MGRNDAGSVTQAHGAPGPQKHRPLRRWAAGLAAALLLSPALPALAEPPLNQPTIAVWPLGYSDDGSAKVARQIEPMLVDTLRSSGSFGDIERPPYRQSRAANQVIAVGRETGAILLISGSVVASGDRATVTVTVQDTISGQVLGVDSMSGPVGDAPDLISQLGQRLIQRWQEGQLQPSVVEWQDGPGVARLDSVPQGAVVEIDRRPVGTTPVLVRGLSLGEHQLNAVIREPITVDTIDIVTAPPGLQLRFDDRDVTFAPLTVSNQSEGTHRVAILGDTPPRQLGLHVLSTPAGAVVRWNGQQIGETPLTTSLQPHPGQHDLTVVARETVTISDAGRQDVSLVLEPFAKIIVTSQPPEADVTLDGRPVGATPISVSVRAGEHTVTVNKRTFVPETRTLTLAAGGVADVQTTLEPARQADGTVVALPTGEVAPGLALTPFLLGFGRTDQGRGVSWLGMTASYGWPKLVTIGPFPIGLGIGAATMRADGDRTALWQAGGLKLQVLQQGDEWPVSASVGTWGQGSEQPYWQGYAAMSRQIGDFTVHLGVATGGLSIGANYHRLPHWVLGGVAYLDYGMLQGVGASTVPMFGLRAGYVF
jgi:TolB-like protein